MISRKDGSTINVEASTNVLERDGRPIGVQMMLRDIVEQKQAERDRGLVYRILSFSTGGAKGIRKFVSPGNPGYHLHQGEPRKYIIEIWSVSRFIEVYWAYADDRF